MHYVRHILLTFQARHVVSISLEQTFKFPGKLAKKAFKNINNIAIHYASSILPHKRRFENNQAMPIEQY